MGRPTEAAWLPRLDGATGPKYLAIADAIADAVASGSLRAGDRLPPQRELAKSLAVDLTTVTRAFGEAQRRGLLDARVGRGSFVRGMELGRRALAAPTIVDMSMNMPPQPEAARLRARIAEGTAAIMAADDALTQLHYQDSAGIAAHREAAAAWLAVRLGPVAVERVIVASGGQSALAAILGLTLAPGEALCVGELTYPGLKAAAERGGHRLIPLAMDREGIDPDAFAAACGKARPKAVYVVPSIDNPTTATMGPERRRAIAAVAERHGVSIIEDDAYGALPSDAAPPIAAIAPETTWHIASLSKCATPALRIAYVVSPGLAQTLRLSTEIRATSLMASPLTSALAARWVANGTLDAIVDAIRRENVERQKIARRVLGEGAVAHAEGHHLWLALPGHWRRAEFVGHALHSGLSVVPSDAFATAERPPEAVRVSLGVVPDRERLDHALQRLAFLIERKPASTSII
jgi:DNA-binding transcriptional MocR family regulator